MLLTDDELPLSLSAGFEAVSTTSLLDYTISRGSAKKAFLKTAFPAFRSSPADQSVKGGVEKNISGAVLPGRT